MIRRVCSFLGWTLRTRGSHISILVRISERWEAALSGPKFAAWMPCPLESPNDVVGNQNFTEPRDGIRECA